MYGNPLRFLVAGNRASGVVESISHTRRGTTVVAISFELPGGRKGRFETHENLRWGYAEGDAVRVAYYADDPTRGEILSFPQMWFPLTLKVCVGVLAFWGSHALWKRRRRRK